MFSACKLNRVYFLCVLVSICFTYILAAKKCPIPNTGKTGTKGSVHLSLFRCVHASSSKKPACSPRPSSRETLKRGEVVDLNYDVNGYAVTAKFFGYEVCVAYRKISSIRTSGGYKRTNKCSSECFTEEETETYKSNFVGRQKLKFVVSDSAGCVTATVSLVPLIVSMILS